MTNKDEHDCWSPVKVKERYSLMVGIKPTTFGPGGRVTTNRDGPVKINVKKSKTKIHFLCTVTHIRATMTKITCLPEMTLSQTK